MKKWCTSRKFEVVVNKFPFLVKICLKFQVSFFVLQISLHPLCSVSTLEGMQEEMIIAVQ